jgi:Ribbon-helix-helix protein, copG family
MIAEYPVRIGLMLSKEMLDAIHQGAAERNISVSEFVRQQLAEAAKRSIAPCGCGVSNCGGDHAA